MYNEVIVAGLMSGTSCDGLDVAVCSFSKEGENIRWELVESSFLPYTPDWRKRLQQAPQLRAAELAILDVELGNYFARGIAQLTNKVDIVASHGHTVVHDPSRGYSLQIGNGATISAQTTLPVITDFRSADVALGGQGAPLVPGVERLLYPDYFMFLNLGGICNIALHHPNAVTAYDIAPCNALLDAVMATVGEQYDADGQLTAQGEVVLSVLSELLDWSYLQKLPPKSLDKEACIKELWPLIHPVVNDSPADALATIARFVAIAISLTLKQESGKVLLTGGGALNNALIDHINEACINVEVVVPSLEQVQFKEAICFAMLGYTKLAGESNILPSVSGGKHPISAGTIIDPYSKIQYILNTRVR